MASIRSSRSCGPLPLQKKWIKRDIVRLRTSRSCGVRCQNKLHLAEDHLDAFDEELSRGGCNGAAAEIVNAAYFAGAAEHLWSGGKK